MLLAFGALFAVGVVPGLALVRSAASFGGLLVVSLLGRLVLPGFVGALFARLGHPGLFGWWVAVLAVVTFVVVLLAVPETAHAELDRGLAGPLEHRLEEREKPSDLRAGVQV